MVLPGRPGCTLSDPRLFVEEGGEGVAVDARDGCILPPVRFASSAPGVRQSMSLRSPNAQPALSSGMRTAKPCSSPTILVVQCQHPLKPVGQRFQRVLAESAPLRRQRQGRAQLADRGGRAIAAAPTAATPRRIIERTAGYGEAWPPCSPPSFRFGFLVPRRRLPSASPIPRRSAPSTTWAGTSLMPTPPRIVWPCSSMSPAPDGGPSLTAILH